jgi:hypothetical protein
MPTSSDEKVLIGNASFPKPFTNGLEFNAPVHGTWNIVHIGFRIPSAHQIYICADNCLRGVVMTAAEMGELGRFSSVVLEEDDMTHSGRIEETTIEGVTDCLNKLPSVPPVVIIFPVCVHKFMGCDIDFIYRELGKRFPDVKFVRGFMDPVMQKRGTTPDQRLRRAMSEIIPELPENVDVISFAGSDMPASHNDFKTILVFNNKTVKDTANCKTLDEYLSIGETSLFICQYPAGLMATQTITKRLNRKFIYAPLSFGFDTIKNELDASGLDIPDSFIEDGITSCESEIKKLKELIGDTTVAIDYTVAPKPLSLARFLLDNGINVKTVYLDAIDGSEEEDFKYLAEKYPELVLHSTIHVGDRRLVRSEEKILAVGQKAAWFEGTEYFVNMIEGGGLYGFAGIAEFIKLMEDAFVNAKDLRDVVPRKGLGCRSCI